jgi:hypothetical protein
MQKSYQVVSATFVSRDHPFAINEDKSWVSPGIEASLTLRWYHQLWNVTNMPVPVMFAVEGIAVAIMTLRYALALKKRTRNVVRFGFFVYVC